MLITLTELQQTDGFYENKQSPVAIEAACIESVRPGVLQDYAGPCCVIRTAIDDEPLYVAGEVESVLATLQAAEVSAVERLNAIEGILAQGR